MFEPEKLDDLLNNAPALRRVLEEIDRLRGEAKHLGQEKELTWQMAMQYKEQNITFREQTQHLEHEVRQLKMTHDQEVKKLKVAFDSERQALAEHMQDLQGRTAKQEQDLQYFRRLPMEAPAAKEYVAKLETELAESKRQLVLLQEQRDLQVDQRFREKRLVLEGEFQERFAERIRTLEEHWKSEQQERQRQAQAAAVLQQELYARLNQVEDTLNQERTMRQEADRQRTALQQRVEQTGNERQALAVRMEGVTRDAESFRREKERLQGELAQHLQLDGPAREALEQRLREAESELSRERARRQAAEIAVNQTKQVSLEKKAREDDQAEMARELAKERVERDRLARQAADLMRQLERLQTENQELSQQLLGAVAKAESGASLGEDVRQTWPIAMKSFLTHTEQALRETIQKLHVHYQEREQELNRQLEQATKQLEVDKSQLKLEMGQLMVLHQDEVERTTQERQKELERLKAFHTQEVEDTQGRAREESARLRDERRRVEAQLSHAEQELAPLREEVERALAQSREEGAKRREERRQLEDQLRQADRTLTTVRQELAEQIQQLQQAFTEQMETSKQAKGTLPQLQGQIAEERAKVHDLQERLTKAEAARVTLEADIARRVSSATGDQQEELIKQLHEADIRMAEMQERIRQKDQEVMDLLSRNIQAPLLESQSPGGPRPLAPVEPLRPKVLWQEPARSQAQGGLLVSELVFGIAHQLRNPLGIIRANVQYCLRTLKLKPREKDQLAMVIRNIEHITKRIQEFVDFTRPMRFAFAPVRIPLVLEDTLGLVKARCQEQKIQLESSVAPGLPAVSGDAEKIKQVFLNLLLNAVEAMPNGGALKVRVTADDHFVTVAFEDTGRGIKKEHLPQAMVPFFTTKEGGLGLGLAYSKQIMAAHHGTMDMASPGEQKGSTVTVTLPILLQS